MSKPSILMINRVYPPERGATGRMMQDLAHALVENGWRVTVLSVVPEQIGTPPQSINHQKIVSKVKPKSLMGYGWNWALLFYKAMKLPKHDIVLTMTDPPMLSLLGRYVASAKNTKHVHWCQDMYPDLLPALKVKFPKILMSLLERVNLRTMRKSKRVVVIGQCMARRLCSKGISPNKVTCIPNWTDFEILSPSAGADYTKLPEKIQSAAKRPEHMFRDDSPKFRVLYAGSVGRAHPVRAVVEAAEILSEYKEIEFLFVGDKHAHSVLAQERAKRGLENIKFMPFQPLSKLRQVMESGDIHLVTMREEARGMLVPCKFYSGLSVGRPTVFLGPPNCEISDVIQQYNAGVVVTSADGRALADAIYQYRTNGDLWFAAQEGAILAAQNYHPSNALQKWVTLLESVKRQ